MVKKRVCDFEECKEELIRKHSHKIYVDGKKVCYCDSCYINHKKNHRQKTKDDFVQGYYRRNNKPKTNKQNDSTVLKSKFKKEKEIKKAGPKIHYAFALSLAEKQYLFKCKLKQGLSSEEADEFVRDLNENQKELGKMLRQEVKENKLSEEEAIKKAIVEKEKFMGGLL